MRWLDGKLQELVWVHSGKGTQQEWREVPRYLTVVCPKCQNTGLATTDDVHRVNPVERYCPECEEKIARGE